MRKFKKPILAAGVGVSMLAAGAIQPAMAEVGFGICDFVCPKDAFQRNFPCDFMIWMDTIKEGRFEDTNKAFQEPSDYDIRITEWIDLNQLRKC